MTIGSLVQSLNAGTLTNTQHDISIIIPFFLQEGKMAAEYSTTDRTLQLLLTVRNTGKQFMFADLLLLLVVDKLVVLSEKLLFIEGHFDSTNLSLLSMTAPLTLSSNFGSQLPGGGAQPINIIQVRIYFQKKLLNLHSHSGVAEDVFLCKFPGLVHI